MDTSNTKDVLEIQDVRLSAHKGAHLSDSDGYTDIGLSSEEEAEDLDPAPQFRGSLTGPPLLNLTQLLLYLHSHSSHSLQHQLIRPL